MSSRHQPLNGADSEPLSQYDRSCDECLRTIYGETLHWTRVDGRSVLLCHGCYVARGSQPETIAGQAAASFVKDKLDQHGRIIMGRLIRAAEKEAVR